ncbi:aldehyde dehydrogenase [Aspergillus californicus]
MSDLEIELTAPNGIKFTQPLGLFINNEWVPSLGGDRIATIDPATESEICTVHGAGADDVDKAVEAARQAFVGEWRTLDTSVRGQQLHKLADLVEQHADVLATIDAWDNGKTYKAARDEDLPGSVSLLRYYAGWTDKIHGTVVEPNAEKLAYILCEPVGVCAAIIPWNFPVVNFITKLAPALAAGNTIVIKVAEQTPLSALYLANLVRESGFPPGVVNVLNGMGREAGSALAGHPDVSKVTFTGSTPTGRKIMETAAGTLKRVTLETGGKSPMLIFPDADIKEAVHWGHLGIMANQGQVCSATSRIFVHASIYDDFLALFKTAVEQLSKVGNPFHDHAFQGPQVTEAQFKRVMSYINIGKREGARLLHGGGALKDISGKGLYIEPTVFVDVTDDMTIARDEVFGPFVTIAPFHDEAEVIERANNTIFGLGAAVFTRDISRALRVSRMIQSGSIWINSSNDADVRIPFGGYKQSGFGREMGAEGLEAYTITKSIHINLNSKL